MELLVGAIIGAFVMSAVGWLVAHLAPGVFAWLIRHPPVRVHVDVDPANIHAGTPDWVGSAWVLPTLNPDQLGEPPAGPCRDWRQWLWAKGAFDGGWSDIRVTLQGIAESTVLVDGLKVSIIERSEPLGGCFVCQVGGAEVMERRIQIDLDWDPGVVSYRAADGTPEPRPRFSLSKGEIEVLNIRAYTAYSSCQWTAELLLIVDGKRQIERLDDDGDRFRTSAIDGLQTWAWRGGRWEGPTQGASDSEADTDELF